METPQPTQDQRHCPSCFAPAVGTYCTNCGEKIVHETITLRYLLTHIPDLFDVEHGILYTMLRMFARPGKELRRYFAGNRSKHYKPFKYVFLLGTVLSLVNVYILDYNYEIFVGGNEKAKESAEFAFTWIPVYFLLMLPLLAGFSKLLFKKRVYTYGEHIVAQAYFIGQYLFILLVTAPLQLLEDDSIYQTTSGVLTILFILYSVYFYYDWIYQRRGRSAILRSLGVVILKYILIVLFILMFAAIFIALFFKPSA
jgi:hypothetical protein